MKAVTGTQTISRSAELARRADAARASLLLIVYHRDGTTAVPLEPGGTLVIGRASPANVVVADPSLSRQHARFTRQGDVVCVEDLGSTNGTWVGREFAERASVPHGAEVVLGTVMVVVHARSAAVTPYFGLEGHGELMAALRSELARSYYFGRPAALVMTHLGPAHGEEGAPLEPGTSHAELHRIAAELQAHLRPVDRVALYGPDALEILLPESGTSDARQLCEAMRTKRAAVLDGVRFGIAAFPESATTADGLLQACREAARAATRANPQCVAPPAATTVVPGADSGAAPPGPVTRSPAMVELLTMARRLARGVIPVLLQGETGTGKEVLARFIHACGPRATKPMVSVNCAAIPAQLVESTLFGHEKGAFTGATARHAGVFEAADGGTVLLDEIGELPAAAQAALLRVLESRSVMRVGSTREVSVDVRILAASHRDLELLAERGDFRKDLYYRLNALTLAIPPLRERCEEVPAFAEHFLQIANQANGRTVRRLEPEALEALAHYDWPGNVRELRNAIERAVVIAQHEVITLADLPAVVRECFHAHDDGLPDGPPEGPAVAAASPTRLPRETRLPTLRRSGEDLRSCLERLEAEVLLEALEHVGGNQTEAAKLLRTPRRTLVRKIKALGLRRLGYTSDAAGDDGDE